MRAIGIYDFEKAKPDYDEVVAKMEELKSKGWKELQYEQGYKHIGIDPYDNDYTVTSKIRGLRPATITDFKVSINDLKADIKRSLEIIQGCNQQKKKQDIHIKSLRREITLNNRTIKKIEKAMNKIKDKV